MLSFNHVAVGLLLLLSYVSAGPLTPRQDDSTLTDLDGYITIDDPTSLPANISISASNSTSLGATPLPKDPFDAKYVYGRVPYSFMFNNFRASLPAEDIYRTIRRQLQDPVYDTKRKKAVSSELDLEGPGWEIDILQNWIQRNTLTYDDQYIILRAIFDFASIYLENGRKQMPVFDLFATRNPTRTGALTLRVRISGKSDVGNGYTLTT